MIGNIKPHYANKSEQGERFMHMYCSLCSSLRSNYSLPYSLLLNYELSFVLLSVDKYLKEESGLTACPSSGFLKRRTKFSHQAIDMAADLSLVLGWLKSIDYVADKKKKRPLTWIVKRVGNKLDDRIQQTLLNITGDTKQAIENYVYISSTSDADLEEIKTYTRTLSEQVCREIVDRTPATNEEKQEIVSFFGQFGVTIAMLDPLVDLEKDLEKGNFNPIINNFETNGRELQHHFMDYLTAYKRVHAAITGQLKEGRSFSPQFKSIVFGSLNQTFGKIKHVADRLFGGIEDVILDSAMACNQGCQNVSKKTPRLGLVAAFIPLDSCGNGCKGCKGPKCDGCGNGCKNADCGNGCKGCNDAGDFLSSV